MVHHHPYRDRIEIIESILNIANGNEVRQSEMLHKANITYAKFKEFVAILLQYDLIVYVQPKKTYKTTSKGLGFLSICNRMKALVISPHSDLSSESFVPIIREK